jgi:hypothetical protein
MPTTDSTTTEDIGQAEQFAFSVVQSSLTQGRYSHNGECYRRRT